MMLVERNESQPDDREHVFNKGLGGAEEGGRWFDMARIVVAGARLLLQ